MKRNGAFSLIEIIIVVAVISILSVYTGVSFALLGPRRLQAQTRKLVSDLCWVRDMAAARHHNFIVDFDTAARSYSVYQDDLDDFIERKSLDVDAVSIDLPSSTFQFNYPRGTLSTNQNIHIILTQGSRTQTVTIFSATGYVRWQ